MYVPAFSPVVNVIVAFLLSLCALIEMSVPFKFVQLVSKYFSTNVLKSLIDSFATTFAVSTPFLPGSYTCDVDVEAHVTVSIFVLMVKLFDFGLLGV